MDSPELTAAVAALLQSCGIDASHLALTAVAGGGNNRVYAADCDGGRFLAKAYFHDAADTRDRLGVEYGFLSYAASLGCQDVPAPVACDPAQHLGIYQFIEGVKIGSAQLTQSHVLAAARFFAVLNADMRSGLALPAASEACFDVAQHLTTVDRRIARLRAITAVDALDAEAVALIGEIAQDWHDLRARIAAADIPPLAPEDRCISPSDFGFHNALQRADGSLCFIDFEYAGWDDPAKMIGDFFCQPAVPVPAEHFDPFISEALRHRPDIERLRARSHALLPVARIKWCCIMLNEFLPEAARRRQFANPADSDVARKRAQLDKTRQFLQSRLV